MHRRSFVRTGVAAGLWSIGGRAFTPQVLEATPRTPVKGPIKLSSNENPLGISPAARQAVVDGLVHANRYPGHVRRPVEEALAEKHGVSTEAIVLGTGSTEVLEMTVHALARPDGTLIVPDPTFEDVPWYATPFALEVVKVPLRSDLAHDLDRMREHTRRTSGPTLVYVCSPNNPTGTLTPCAEIDEWIAEAPEDLHFLVDEAYFEYCQDSRYWSALRWVHERPNVVVTRTFSKIHGMAGLRLGYAIAHPETAARLRQYSTKSNANALVLVAALASLGDSEFGRRSLDVNDRGAHILYQCLDELGLEYIPTHTNFVMHRINGDLKTYNERMLESGIKVGRPFPPMLTYSRVSIGLPDEMEQLVESLRSFRRKGWI